jgi:hypothetical protein
MHKALVSTDSTHSPTQKKEWISGLNKGNCLEGYSCCTMKIQQFAHGFRNKWKGRDKIQKYHTILQTTKKIKTYK